MGKCFALSFRLYNLFISIKEYYVQYIHIFISFKIYNTTSKRLGEILYFVLSNTYKKKLFPSKKIFFSLKNLVLFVLLQRYDRF